MDIRSYMEDRACDLAARMLLSPLELPIGVVTSLIGAVVFVFIYARARQGREI